MPRLRITEIFLSLQGEARSVGMPTVFVRLTGCPLRCAYCDTSYAFTGGEWMHLDDIVEHVCGFAVRHVCVTGGEPLAQPGSLDLLRLLCDAGLDVSLETSGAIDVSGVDARVVKVVDVKTPSSGETDRNYWPNIDQLTLDDQVKFVISDRADYEWSSSVLKQRGLDARCEVLFSPVHGSLAPRELSDWILDDRLPVRFQLQLHKILWGGEPGH